MDQISRGLLFGLVATLLVGCGSGSGGNAYPDATVADAPRAETTPIPRDGGSDVPQPPPVTGEGNIMLFKGQAQMLVNGPACTGELGAATDRWCAFTSKSSTSIDGIDLFVINVSRAAAGTVVACGGGVVDPNCLRLTAGFSEETAEPFPHAAGFRGDTLVYFDRTDTGYGWRPGLTNGRVLAEGALHDCFASPQGSSILCLRDLEPQAVPGITQSELLVGRLDGPGERPLVVVDTVISAEAAARPGQLRFRNGFRPDGEYVAWSSRAQMGGPEILKTQKVGDATTRVTVATDVSRWSISPDGTRWYWLSQFNYDIAGMRSGILQAAPFPLGTAPTTLLPSVGEFTVTRSGAIVARTMVMASRGTLQAIPDPVAAPATITTLDTGVLGFLTTSAQGHVAYTKAVDPVFPFLDLYVKNLNGTDAGCPLIRQPIARSAIFFPPSGGAAIWANVTNLDSTIDEPFRFRVSFTRLSDCTTMTVASAVAGYGVAGDDAVLVEDQSDGAEGSLRIQQVRSGNVLGTDPPVLIQTRVNNYVPVTPTPAVVLFTVSASSPNDGLYLHPIAAPGAGGTDAGSQGQDAAADISADGGSDGGG